MKNNEEIKEKFAARIRERFGRVRGDDYPVGSEAYNVASDVFAATPECRFSGNEVADILLGLADVLTTEPKR